MIRGLVPHRTGKPGDLAAQTIVIEARTTKKIYSGPLIVRKAWLIPRVLLLRLLLLPQLLRLITTRTRTNTTNTQTLPPPFRPAYNCSCHHRKAEIPESHPLAGLLIKLDMQILGLPASRGSQSLPLGSQGPQTRDCQSQSNSIDLGAGPLGGGAFRA